MEILRHHVLNLKQLLDGLPEAEVHSRLRYRARSMIRWTIGAESLEPAYPGLQTEGGFNHFIEVEEQMYRAINSGNFVKLDDKKTDDLCSSCGNLTENGCRLRGKEISQR